ncbi:DUF6286 domain-containing protein [Nonomuraea basaltis]|uniref:DUF6286 domain-containing protein n=1 Tax=Nonomuraea basaltis TaxID=2495887 RepID=UPI00110C6FDE|nr:DUF6286 domain-containing protein [Nonomuraea basaltis]TMS00747.1 hypothetical protein EJK15_00375 [Nonomuraea basaltis]
MTVWTTLFNGPGRRPDMTAQGGQEVRTVPVAGPGADPAAGGPGTRRSAGEPPPRDRAADRATVRAFRSHRRVPAIVVAGLLTILGLLVAAETISALTGRPQRLVPYDRMLAWASSTLWSDPLFLAGAALVTLTGLALLAVALVPGRPRMVPVRGGDPDLIIGLRPKSLTRALAHAAEEVSGVHSARARIRGRTVTVTATTSGWGRERFRKAVRAAVLTRLAGLDPVEPYRVVVDVKERK